MHTLDEDVGPYLSRRHFLESFMHIHSMLYTPLVFSRKHRNIVEYMRDYFGEQIALYWNFLHYYATWLVLLSLFSVIAFVAVM
jgi:hypothetical protein